MNAAADTHVHTTLSCDGKDDLITMVRAALDKGLAYICFTEHMDLNLRDDGYGFFDPDAYSRAIDQARQQYGDRIIILKGIEFAEPHLYPRELEQVRKGDYDFILGSVHWLGTYFVGERIFREQYTPEDVFRQYFTEVLSAVKSGGFDALAHLDLPKRYLKTFPGLSDTVDEILETMIQQNIALEINTSPLRKGLPECSPSLPFLQRYIHLGGNRIILGSDAHSREEIAAGFDFALEMLAACGAEQPGVYVNRTYRIP